MNDPAVEFKDLLDSNYNASNTVLSDKPAITTGWYNKGSDAPLVTVTEANESEATGSNTGWTYIKGDGSGPDQATVGLILINIWCNDNQTALNPKEVVNSVKDEIERVILGNYEATQYESIGVNSTTKLVEDDQSPVMHRCEIEAIYNYTKRNLII